jgi:hypothetical protein
MTPDPPPPCPSSTLAPPLLLTIFLAAGCSHSPSPATPGDLGPQVEQQRRESEHAVKAYIPKVQGRIDDLSAPTVEILRQLPGVASVEVLVAAKKPTHRVIHLADWHFVDRELFALELRGAGASTDQEVDARYRDFLRQVELVQLEQEGLLRCLLQHHHLRRILYEGLTPVETRAYRDKAAELREAGPAIQEQLQEARRLLKAAGKEGTERYSQALRVEKAALGLLEEHRLDVLRLGAPGRLVGVEVLPLDDAALLDKGKPVRDGKVKLDPAAVKARNDAPVRAALQSGPVSLIILGGGHDLNRQLSVGPHRLHENAAELPGLLTTSTKTAVLVFFSESVMGFLARIRQVR